MENINITPEDLTKLKNNNILEKIKVKFDDDDEHLEQYYDNDGLLEKLLKNPNGKSKNSETAAYVYALNNKMTKLSSELINLTKLKETQIDDYNLLNLNLKNKLKVALQENSDLKYIGFAILLLNSLFFISSFDRS